MNYIDPYGLVGWEVEFFISSVEVPLIGLGWVGGIIKATSDCDSKGYRVTAYFDVDTYGLVGTPIKKLKHYSKFISAENTTFRVQDQSDEALTQNLEGSAIITTSGLSVGKGGGLFEISFGNVEAVTSGESEGFNLAGASATFGTVEHINNDIYRYSREKCKCDIE